VIHEEGLPGDTQKVAVQNGCYYRFLDVLLMLLRGDKGSARPLWNFVLLESERYFFLLFFEFF